MVAGIGDALVRGSGKMANGVLDRAVLIAVDKLEDSGRETDGKSEILFKLKYSHEHYIQYNQASTLMYNYSNKPSERGWVD